MTLVVEDGTGLANAESYLSVADATDYFVRYGNPAWNGEIPDLEAALRRATQYIDSEYRFKGCKLTPTQALQWPRDGYTMASLGVTWPVVRLRQACAELAVRALADSLYTDQSDAAVKSGSIGPISVTYAASANNGQVRFVVVDELLSQFTMGGRNTVRIEVA
jgi:hypothetical protein